MELKDYLTCEPLLNKFPNQFDLVTHAIHVAEHMILSSGDAGYDIEKENPALVALEKILEGVDESEEELFLEEAQEKKTPRTSSAGKNKLVKKEPKKTEEEVMSNAQ